MTFKIILRFLIDPFFLSLRPVRLRILFAVIHRGSPIYPFLAVSAASGHCPLDSTYDLPHVLLPVPSKLAYPSPAITARSLLWIINEIFPLCSFIIFQWFTIALKWKSKCFTMVTGLTPAYPSGPYRNIFPHSSRTAATFWGPRCAQIPHSGLDPLCREAFLDPHLK